MGYATFWLLDSMIAAIVSATRGLHMADRIEKSIELNAPIERVWRALTDHVEFADWFRVTLDGPFVPGETASGRMSCAGHEGLKWEAKIQKMQAPTYFSFTWHPYAVDPNVDYAPEKPTLVEFRLEPTATGTRLFVCELGFDALPSHRRPDALRMNDAGWTQQVENIKAHVER